MSSACSRGNCTRRANDDEGRDLVGAYENVAAMLDDIAEVDGGRGTRVAFDDFLTGVEDFGARIPDP